MHASCEEDKSIKSLSSAGQLSVTAPVDHQLEVNIAQNTELTHRITDRTEHRTDTQENWQNRTDMLSFQEEQEEFTARIPDKTRNY